MSPSNSPANSTSIGSLVVRFEKLWQSGKRPDPERFLASLPSALRPAVLIEVLHADLEFRLKAGEPARVEEYLARFPEVARRPEDVASLIVTEYRQRRRREPGLDPAEYRERFPDLAGKLEEWPPSRPDWERTTVRVGPPPDDVGGPPTVPGYEVLEQLGRGGMGVVWKARDTRLKRVVALKMIRGGAEVRQHELARFRSEAEALARLAHPNIIAIHEVGEANGQPYFALEYAAGGSLAEKWGGDPQRPSDAAELVRVLAEGVHAAHGKGVVHRDLKPANVLLTDDGTPKVTDFGLAKKLDESGQTQTGQVMGTPSYMAPEQAAGKVKELTPAVDVWALGAVLYEGLTGRPPFKGATPLDTMRLVVDEEPVPPRALQPGVPRDLETICLKCLQKSPGRRYATAGELAGRLQLFLDGRPTPTGPWGWRNAAGAGAGATRWPRGSWRLWRRRCSWAAASPPAWPCTHSARSPGPTGKPSTPGLPPPKPSRKREGPGGRSNGRRSASGMRGRRRSRRLATWPSASWRESRRWRTATRPPRVNCFTTRPHSHPTSVTRSGVSSSGGAVAANPTSCPSAVRAR